MIEQLYIYCCMTFILAIILSFDQNLNPEAGSNGVAPIGKILLMIMFAGMISVKVFTFEAFFIVFTSSIGVYKIIRMILDWILNAISFDILWRNFRKK